MREVVSATSSRHLYGHAGGGVGFIAQVHYVVEDDLVVAVLSNCDCFGGAVEVADRVMRQRLGIPGPVDLPLAPDEARKYTGRYVMDGEHAEIVEEGEHLVFKIGGESHRLRYQGSGEFAQDGRLSRLHFHEANGRVTGFVLARYGSTLAKATRE